MRLFADILSIIGFFLLLEPYPFIDSHSELFILGKIVDDNSIHYRFHKWIHGQNKFKWKLDDWAMNDTRKAVGFLLLFIGSFINILSDF